MEISKKMLCVTRLSNWVFLWNSSIAMLILQQATLDHSLHFACLCFGLGRIGNKEENFIWKVKSNWAFLENSSVVILFL
jgi:hypothetical protein